MSPLAGRLLIARPGLHDDNFDFTVSILLEHNDGGALALVLNRPSELTVADAFPAWTTRAAEPAVVHAGGPVERSGLIALGVTAAADGDLPFGLESLDLDEPPPSTAERVRIFAGYAGWGPGQLEGELAGAAWWVVDAFLDDVFHEDPLSLWADVLRRQGGELAWFAHYPPDPSVN